MASKPVHPQVAIYLQRSRKILAAGDAVADAISSSASIEQREQEIEYTVDQLKKAVADTEEQRPGRIGFSESGNAGARAPLPPWDQLTVAAADAAVAQVLFAASDAVGEQTARTGPDGLRHAVRSADANLVNLEPTAPAAHEFSGKRRFSSEDLTKATHLFQDQAKDALDRIMESSDAGVSKLFNALAAQKDKILDAFSKAAELFAAPSDAGFFIQKGWEKLLSALQVIRQIVNSDSLEQVREYLSEWEKAMSVRAVLKKIFGYDELAAQIEALHLAISYPVERVDLSSSELAELKERFATMVGNIRTITAIAAPLLSLSTIHLTGPLAPLVMPACYALSIAAIVLLGRDFTGSGLSNEGRGMRRIVEKLQQ